LDDDEEDEEPPEEPPVLEEALLEMVELPTVEVNVDPPEVMVLKIAAVETADEPAPAAPKRVVEPTVVVMVDEPLVTTETTAAVDMGVAPDSDE